jgi:hypothetical protein
MPGSNLGGSEIFSQINDTLVSIAKKNQNMLLGIKMKKMASTILEDDELIANNDLGTVSHYLNPF